MTRLFSLCIAACAICALFVYPVHAQDDPGPGKIRPIAERKVNKPFKVLTSGKQITIKSTDNENNLRQILVWTSTGHRIVEQHEMDVPSFDFSVSGINERVFFLMVEFKNGKRFSEKIGVR
ncbi:MAG: hypothetical protein IT214_03785 [Chitinophagaceae bacterium]|nr:hypothetical protein [Chitinophagaceae bacterium]OQY95776.1 MAG: hypothetical protein B6D37_04790 [Sphingobacteriales bacterium UTBCD1]